MLATVTPLKRQAVIEEKSPHSEEKKQQPDRLDVVDQYVTTPDQLRETEL